MNCKKYLSRRKIIYVIFLESIFFAVSGCTVITSNNINSDALALEPQNSTAPTPQPIDRTTPENDKPGSNFYRNAENSTLLNGPVVGSYTFTAARNLIPFPLNFSVTDEHPDLKVVGTNAATIYTGNTRGPGIIGVLENVSNRVYCEVKIELNVKPTDTAKYPDALDNLSTYLIGTKVKINGNSDFNDQCAAPGSKYYFYIAPLAASTTDFASVEITKVTSYVDNSVNVESSVDYELEPSSAIATSYGIISDDVIINVVNNGSVEFDSKTFGTTVFGLHGRGLPVFVSVEQGVGKLLPGEKGFITMREKYLDLPRQSVFLRVILSH